MRFGLSLAVMLAAPAMAPAQGATCDEEAARVPYKAAVVHMRAARYAEAPGELERANQLRPDPRLIFKQCQCREHVVASVDGCAAAAGCYDRYFAACEGRACPGEQAARQRREHLLGALCGRVHVTSGPPGAALSVDSAPSGEMPREILLQPGGHTFAASWFEHQTVQWATKVRGGANAEVALTKAAKTSTSRSRRRPAALS